MGLSYAEISRQLFISENTVAKHVKAAHRKTGCTSFLELFAPYFREAAVGAGT
jgi:DNA-binding CsgD family transcriptional regulator